MTDSQRYVEVVVKRTRHGNIATIADPSADSGVRCQTDVERDAIETHKKILDSIDEETFKHDTKLAEIHVPTDGNPRIEWCDDAARAQYRSGGASP